MACARSLSAMMQTDQEMHAVAAHQPSPLPLAFGPKASAQDANEAFQAVQNGIDSGTMLAPPPQRDVSPYPAAGSPSLFLTLPGGLPVLDGDRAPSSMHHETSIEQVRLKILAALNGARCTEEGEGCHGYGVEVAPRPIVPSSGCPSSLKAVFIRSTAPQYDERDAKAAIVEAVSETECIQKSAPMHGGGEAFGGRSGPMDIDNSSTFVPSGAATAGARAAYKSSYHGMRKFSSWLSYFYTPRSTSSSERSSPTSEGSSGDDLHDPTEAAEGAAVPGEPIYFECAPRKDTLALIAKVPARGILRQRPRPSAGDDAMDGVASEEEEEEEPIPSPVQKATFLRQQEMNRLAGYSSASVMASSALLPWSYNGPEPNSSRSSAASQAGPRGRQRGGAAAASSPGSSGEEAGSPDERRTRSHIYFDLTRSKCYPTHSRSEYERGGVAYIAKSLTADVALLIKRELNEVKREMPIHEASRCHTQFYNVR